MEESMHVRSDGPKPRSWLEGHYWDWMEHKDMTPGERARTESVMYGFVNDLDEALEHELYDRWAAAFVEVDL